MTEDTAIQPNNKRAVATAKELLSGGALARLREVVLHGVAEDGSDRSIFLRQLKAKDVLELNEQAGEQEQRSLMLRLIAKQVCDAEGNQMFKEDEIGELPGPVFNLLMAALNEQAGASPKPAAGTEPAAATELNPLGEA